MVAWYGYDASDYKMVNFLVRFCALLSFLGLVTGFSSNNYQLQISEIVMILIWLMSDWSNIANAVNSIKERLTK
jgi:hypothetical protein